MRYGGVLVQGQELPSGGIHSQPQIDGPRNSQVRRDTEVQPESVCPSGKVGQKAFPSAGSLPGRPCPGAGLGTSVVAGLSPPGVIERSGLFDTSLQDIALPWAAASGAFLTFQVPPIPFRWGEVQDCHPNYWGDRGIQILPRLQSKALSQNLKSKKTGTRELTKRLKALTDLPEDPMPS